MRTLWAVILALLLSAIAWPPPGIAQNPPFEVGEEVLYEVHYKPLFLTPAFKAGELRMKLERPTDGDGNYRISAWVRSAGILMSLAGLDVQDYMESTMDAMSLASIKFRHQVRTNRKQEDISVSIDRSRKLALLEVIDVSSDPPRKVRSQTYEDIPEDVSDYLSVFYRLRAAPLEVGQEFAVPLSENGRLNQVELAVLEQDDIKIPLGRYETIRVTTQGGLFRGGGELQIWFSLDRFRIPVKFEADVRFGRVYGHLIEVQTPRMAKSRIKTE